MRFRDVMTPKQRSLCMSHIRGSNTGPELRIRHAIWREGLRYRLKYALPGRPDMVFVSARTVVFVDGCFWHGCPKHGAMPKNNRLFWQEKLWKNIKRDRHVTATLEAAGWRVLRFWEHEVEKNLVRTVSRIVVAVGAPTKEIKHVRGASF